METTQYREDEQWLEGISESWAVAAEGCGSTFASSIRIGIVTGCRILVDLAVNESNQGYNHGGVQY